MISLLGACRAGADARRRHDKTMDARIEITIIDEEGEGWCNEPLLVNVSDFSRSDGYADTIRKRMIQDVEQCYAWMRENWHGH